MYRVHGYINFKTSIIIKKHKWFINLEKNCNTIKQIINVHNICIIYKCFPMMREALKVMISMDPSILHIPCNNSQIRRFSSTKEDIL